MASTVSQSVGLVNRSDVKDSSHGVLELQTRALPDGLYLASFTDWPRLYHSFVLSVNPRVSDASHRVPSRV